jgi:arylsulfatase A-like enzyme
MASNGTTSTDDCTPAPTPTPTPPPPNILLITCDQFRFPRFSYGDFGGFDELLKKILGFQDSISEHNPYAKFFPGLLRLRNNAVVLRNHTIAASACTPSRAVIYTGQYGTRTGVTQTDGLFKNGDSPNFPWLAADGIPTLGTWMREAGYATHYFGKWHVSNPPEHSLKRYGFDNWEESYPEPHGAQPNNLGMYRDIGFTDSACNFLRRQGLALNYNRAYASMSANDPNSTGPDKTKIPPWFAVVSFTNPHDIATYPGVIAQALPGGSPGGTQSIFGPLTVPAQSDDAMAPDPGTMTFPLNPDGFPQDCARKSPTQDEDLSTKPSAQFEASYKVGLALAAKGGYNIVNGLVSAAAAKGITPPGTNEFQAMVDFSLASCIPFQLATEKQGGADANCVEFLQFYAWLHAVVDTHINAVLDALEESGQAGNTIVMFLADHGEYAAAHGMMIEKWYTAYQEALHVPVVVQFPGGPVPLPAGMIAPEPVQIDALTSHVDILPTVLGLAGVDADQRKTISAQLAETRPVPPLPGVDLAPMIVAAARGETPDNRIIEPNGEERMGVLFITDDQITMPLPPSRTLHEQQSLDEFKVYQAVVDAVIAGTVPGKGPVALTSGGVKQPCHVRAVRTQDYKLVRYFDPSGREPQEWEMYDMRADPNEEHNLVQVTVTPPTVREGVPASVQETADSLAQLLRQLEVRYLS